MRYKIDRDTRTLVLKYVKKSEEYRAWVMAEADRICGPSSAQIDGMPRASWVSDKTAGAVEKLEKLMGSHKAKVVRAVDEAKQQIGADIEDESQRRAIQNAIWLSCLNGREYNFEAFEGGIACGRAFFYRLKNKFLYSIKAELGL